MDTRFEFLQQLDRDLRGAAARERLSMEESERGLAGGGPTTVPFRSRRGASPAPRRRRTWAMAAAASLAVLILAGSIGFVATGGLPAELGGSVLSPVTGGGAGGGDAPAEGVRGLPTALQDSFLNLGDTPQAQSSPAPGLGDEQAGGRTGGETNLSKIVRDGRIGVVVDDGRFGEARAAVNAIALDNDGFVLSSSTQGRRGTFVLRVPDQRFITTITSLREIGTVEYEDQTGEDVTAEFVDLTARERILLARKRVLLGFLRDATTVSETLSLYSRVEDTQLQLERIQGQLRFLRDQVSESTVRVQIRERAVRAETTPEVDKPSLGVAWERAVQGCLNVIAAIVVGIGYLIPVAVIVLLVWLVVRFARNRSATSA